MIVPLLTMMALLAVFAVEVAWLLAESAARCGAGTFRASYRHVDTSTRQAPLDAGGRGGWIDATRRRRWS
jgi:hypothetical protein